MKITYLLNTYPLTSTTFIRREIEALEQRGHVVKRFASRPWSETPVDELDRLEIRKTEYLLSQNVLGLIKAAVKELIFNFPRLISATAMTLRLRLNAKSGTVKHIAYLLQSIYFRQRALEDDIRHVHVHFFTNATSIALLSRILGGPSYSVTAHGPDEFTNGKTLSIDLKTRHSEFIVAISEFCKKQIMSYSDCPDGGANIKIGRCGIALEEFPDEDVASENNHTLVCVGRICPQKGQVHIPKAVAELRREFPALRIVVVGDGESRHELEEQIRLHDVVDNVQLTGWATNAEVRRLISANRALVLPSYAEGLPIVIMEALALHRPVISTYIAGIPELVDESCGWLFHAGSEAGLVAAMRAALTATPEALAAMGREGRRRVVALHDRRNLASLLEREFERVAVASDGKHRVAATADATY